MSGIFYKDGLMDGRSGIRTALQLDGAPFGHEGEIPCDIGHDRRQQTPRGPGRQRRPGQGAYLRGHRRLEQPATGSHPGTDAPTGTWDPAETTQTAEGKLIAYGSLFVDKSTEGEQMVEATLPLNFYDPAAGRPTGKYSIIISCSTSAYGDYMVGCTTNVMYVDDFQWVY